MPRDATTYPDQLDTYRAPRPDRSELAEFLRQAPLPDGFGLEWVFDRFDLQAERR